MEKENQIIAWALQNNPEAIAYCTMVFEASQIWDDMIDGDKPVDKEAINSVFWNILVAMPGNSFYRQHIDSITPIIMQSITDWHAANALEKGSEHEQSIAFVLRDSVSALLIHCATLIGGYKWARQVAPEIRKAIHNETLEDYKAGFGGQQVTDEEDAEYDMIETAIAVEEVE